LSWGALDVGVLLYEYVQLIIAFTAFVLAIKWKKTEFIGGLFFLLLYAFIDAVDIFIFTVTDQPMVDFSQFGFVLLAILSFTIAMRPQSELQQAKK
jgi:hypothetical protein